MRQRQVQAPKGTYITISEAVPPTTPAPSRAGSCAPPPRRWAWG
ncbi:hypothetical protein ACFQQB_27235 [Nonomuraea rubra]